MPVCSVSISAFIQECLKKSVCMCAHACVCVRVCVCVWNAIRAYGYVCACGCLLCCCALDADSPSQSRLLNVILLLSRHSRDDVMLPVVPSMRRLVCGVLRSLTLPPIISLKHHLATWRWQGTESDMQAKNATGRLSCQSLSHACTHARMHALSLSICLSVCLSLSLSLTAHGDIRSCW